MSNQISKTIWDILEDYCKQINYGEISIKVIIHNGRAVAFEETQPPVRKFREIKKSEDKV